VPIQSSTSPPPFTDCSLLAAVALGKLHSEPHQLASLVTDVFHTGKGSSGPVRVAV
jgi:hypothetical protein